MGTAELTAFWIKSPLPHAPLGLGVTAYSLADALAILHAVGYGSWLPEDLNDVSITEGVSVGALDQSHVVRNMGPISVRGVWYPFVEVGVPAWAVERMHDSSSDASPP